MMFSFYLVKSYLIIRLFFLYSGLDSQLKLSPTLKFNVANKVQDSQLKLNPTPKFPVADKAQDQPKLSPTPKFPVADKVWDQPNFSPTTKFSVIDKARDSQTKLSPTPKVWASHRCGEFTGASQLLVHDLRLLAFIWLQ